MNYEIGYHVVSREVARDHDGFDEMSVVEFLRRVRASERLPLDVSVVGLDQLLYTADETSAACDYIHRILVDGVNHLTREQPVVRFVVEDIEFWDEPVIAGRGEDIPLGEIFYGEMTQQGADWYHTQLNVSS